MKYSDDSIFGWFHIFTWDDSECTKGYKIWSTLLNAKWSYSFLLHLFFSNTRQISERQVYQICFTRSCLLQTPKWIKVKNFVIDPLFLNGSLDETFNWAFSTQKRCVLIKKSIENAVFQGVGLKAYHLFCLENVQVQVESKLGVVVSEYPSLVILKSSCNRLKLRFDFNFCFLGSDFGTIRFKIWVEKLIVIV